MSNTILFNFKLKPPLKCAGLDSDETRENYVCWFYLTDSEYFIDLGEVKLFQSSPQWMEKYSVEGQFNTEFIDYQYSRQLEDLFDILPTIACPMPADLYSLVDTEQKRNLLYDRIVDMWEDQCPGRSWNGVDERYGNIIENLIGFGYLNSSYLRFNSDCRFFNVDGTIIIQYDFFDNDEDGCLVWSAGKGSYTLAYNEFIYEIEDLLDRFFAAMDKQVEMAMQVFSEKALNKSNLTLEHSQRKDYFYSILDSMKCGDYENQIDWQKLRQDLDCLLQKSYLEV